jgi:hypothetical protein
MKRKGKGEEGGRREMLHRVDVVYWLAAPFRGSKRMDIATVHITRDIAAVLTF